MTEAVKKKTTRKLKSFDFSGADSAVALVGPAVGGAANGKSTVLFKSVGINRSEDFIQKAQAVQITLELPEFLERFFNLYGSDAEVLARLMGYVEEPEEDEVEQVSWYENYIQEKLSAFKLLDSFNETDNIAKSLMKLTEDEHLEVLKAQEYLEPIIKQASEKKTTEVVKNKETKMTTKKTEVAEVTDTVEKSKFDEIQKSLTENQVALTKALEEIEVFKAEKKEALRKSRFDAVKGAVGDEAVATTLFKAAGLITEQETFDEVVKALAGMKALVEKSSMFEEVGASAQESAPAEEESGVTKLLKQQFAQK